MGRGARQGDSGSYRMILLDTDLEWVLGASWEAEIPKIPSSILYTSLNKARIAIFESKCNSKEVGIKQRKQEHDSSKAFMTALNEGDIGKVKEFIAKQNQGAILGATLSRTVLLLDGTGSMSALLTAAKETVCTMFERAVVILKEKGVSNDSIQMQFVIYRNYNSKDNKILECSGWETKAENLRKFMSGIGPEGGMGAEAIEIGLWHAVKESETPDSIAQVILIGDAPANTKSDVKIKRARLGEPYWNQTRFATPTYYEDELGKLKTKKIPVHAFFLTGLAKDNFQKIANDTGGRLEALNVNASNSAASLTHFVTEEILRQVVGNEGVELYRAKYVKGYTS